MKTVVPPQLKDRDIIAAIRVSSSQNRVDQKPILKLALKHFDHGIVSVYDKLCDAGSLHVLLKCLKTTYEFQGDDTSRLYCDLIGVILSRSSKEAATRFVHRSGAELIAVLLLFLSKHNMDSLHVSIRGIFHRLGVLKVSFLQSCCGEFLANMMHCIIKCHREANIGLALISCELMSSWTSYEDNKPFVASLPGFFRDISSLTLSPAIKTREPIARLFSHLAWQIRQRAELARKTVLLAALELLVLDTDESTRALATHTIRQLTTHERFRVAICSYKQAAIVRALMDPAKCTDLHTASIQTVLALIERETASKLVRGYPAVVSSLTTVALSANGEVASTIAAHSLQRLAHEVSIFHEAHPIMIEALLLVASSPFTRIRCWAAKAMKEHAQTDINAFYIARTSTTLQSLIKLASDDSSFVKFTATEALHAIASGDSNKKRLVSCPEVMEVVVENAKSAPQCHESGRAAVQLILELMGHSKSKNRLAKHFGLVAALSLYGTFPRGDPSLRRASLNGVCALAPLM